MQATRYRAVALSRLTIAVACGILAALVVPGFGRPVLRWILGWNTFAVVYLAQLWWLILSAGPIGNHPATGVPHPSRRAIFTITVMATVCNFFVAIAVLREAKYLGLQHVPGMKILCFLGLATAWLLTQTLYSQYYAHLHYDYPQPAFEFLGRTAPQVWDFVYVAFTIGMTCQVADFGILRTDVRRSVVLHGLASFAFTTVILATTVNLLAGD